jgi:D-alanyl-D-alanine carboxypeptidase
MNSNFMIKLALTSAFVAVPTIGCTSLGISSTMEVKSSKVAAQNAHRLALKAEKALTKGKLDAAQTFGEAAVEADFQNIEYRAQLAQIYMANGRFASAERTWMDVMELGQVDPRTVISLALSRIALGKVDSAIALVEANRSLVPASDYGLTLALAGQSGRAVEVLSEAIRADNATARTRQNLALAYALDGRWNDARVMATQDMNQDRVNERIAEWAQYARPGAYQTRIAGLLKVEPQSDSGQPVRLALANFGSNLAQNDAELPSAPQASVAQSGLLSAIGPAPEAKGNGFAAAREMETMVAQASAPQSLLPESLAAPQKMAENSPSNSNIRMVSIPVLGKIYDSERAPLIKAASGPAKQAGTASRQSAMDAPRSKSPVKLALADVAPKPSASSSKSGTYLVQLGAFSSVSSAKQAWEKYSNRYSVLSGFSSASSTVVVNGKSFVRLAAMGFGSKQSAVSACQSIKAAGGDCIVRDVSGSQPIKMAFAR